jgi:hypothetical protein
MSDDPMPSAPASISRRTSARISSSCAAVGVLSSSPITCSRIVVAPMNEATFCDTPRRSSPCRYSDSVVHVISNLMSPICSSARCFIAAFSGPIELPSPKICVVTPWRISPCDRPSAISDSVDHDSMLMKPGATASPAASTTVAAAAPERSPTPAMRSPRMPTSARLPAAPLPSYTVPPRITTSKAGSCDATGFGAAVMQAIARIRIEAVLAERMGDYTRHLREFEEVG